VTARRWSPARGAAAFACVCLALLLGVPPGAAGAEGTSTVTGTLRVAVVDGGHGLSDGGRSSDDGLVPDGESHGASTLGGPAGSAGESHRIYALEVDGSFLPLDAGSVDGLIGLAGVADGARVTLDVRTAGLGAAGRGTPGPGTAGLRAASGAEADVVAVRAVTEPAPSPALAAQRPHATHLVLVTDPTAPDGGPAITEAAARGAAARAGQYWITQSRGRITSFPVGAAKPLTYSGACAILTGGAAPWPIWEAARALFPEITFGAGEHVTVVLPPSCARDGYGVGTLGGGIHSGGSVVIGGTNLHALVHEYGHNFSLGHSNLAVVRGGSLLAEEYMGLYGPQSLGVNDFSPSSLDAGYQHLLDVLLAGEVRTVQSGSVTLSPVTGTSGVRAATFTDPVSGRPVFVELRDGKGADVGSFYAWPDPRWFFSEPVPADVVDACEASHGVGAEQCDTRRHYGPGVRVYHLEPSRDVTTMTLPNGLGTKSTLAQGDRLTGFGGGYTVEVTGLSAASATVRISAGAVAAKVSASAPSSSFGSPAQVTVSVTAPATPEGTVTVLSGTKQLGKATLSGGKVTVKLPATLAVGTHALTVRYSGSTSVKAAQATVSLRITGAKPKVAITTTTAVHGKAARATVTVSSAVRPTGKVAIYVDGVKKKTVKLAKGKATYKLAKKLKVGKHKVRAVYLGSAKHARVGKTVNLRVWKSVARITGFASGSKKVKARATYRDTVKLSGKGVLQRKAGASWKKVRSLPRGKSTIAIKAGAAGKTARYRISIKNVGSVKGVTSKVLTLKPTR